jgi:LysM repeat protein
MVARNSGRYLAPIAILIVIAASILIVQGELGSKHPAHHPRAGDLSGLVHRRAVKAASFYTVKAGDSFSTISVKTGVSVNTLESLNQGVNPAALQTGQRLRLRQ